MSFDHIKTHYYASHRSINPTGIVPLRQAYEMTAPGSLVYACHLPGHVAYGMQGTIEVVD